MFDTGRHPEHAQQILDYAKARHRPIAAIVNSHWHLDHTTGNWDIRHAYPHVAVYASNAIEGALATFLKDSRAETDAMLADPKTPPATRDQLERGISVIDHPERIRPNHFVTKSARMRIAGRPLDVHLARFAATEGDVWLYDPQTHEQDLEVAEHLVGRYAERGGRVLEADLRRGSAGRHQGQQPGDLVLGAPAAAVDARRTPRGQSGAPRARRGRRPGCSTNTSGP